MVGSTTRRTRGAATLCALLLSALALTGLAACRSGGDTPETTATSPGDSQLGGAPSGSATPTAAASPTGTGTTAPFFPKDAKSYGFELLKAWAGPDYTRLDQLATSSAVQQIRDSITFGGKPNSQWTYIRCGPAEASGFTSCVYRNAHGDETTIKMENSKLGSQHAVTEVPLERTEYSTDPGSYAAKFMSAWQDGNQQRMARYSSTSIKNYFISQNPALQAWGQDAPEDIGGGYVKVQFSGLSSDSGRYYTLKVLANPDNKAFAIKGYCSGFGCTP